MPRPQPSEFPAYFLPYVEAVPEGDILQILASQIEDTSALLAGLTPAQWLHRYAPGKWSLKEVVGHLIDTERIMSTRALCFARGEQAPYPGFDQDLYVAAAGFDGRNPDSLLREWRGLRAANVALFASLDEKALARRGTADGRQLTVRALPWMLAGHERHHLQMVRQCYLGAASAGGAS